MHREIEKFESIFFFFKLEFNKGEKKMKSENEEKKFE